MVFYNMNLYEIKVRTKLTVKAETQTFLFHRKILNPSSIPKGIKLKRAIHALKAAPIANIKLLCGGDKIEITRKTVDNAIFVVGPAMAIFPMFSLSVNPEIITAPGDIILKNCDIMESNVKMAPINVSLNSAHSPLFCAAILWAISCVKNDVVKMAVKETNIT